jgi:hypothetical protein
MPPIFEETLPITWVEFISHDDAVNNLYEFYRHDSGIDDKHVTPRGADIAPEKSMLLQYIVGFKKPSVLDMDDTVEMYISTYFYKHNSTQLKEIIQVPRTIRSMVQAYRARCQMVRIKPHTEEEGAWQLRTVKVCDCVTRSLQSLLEIELEEDEDAEDDIQEKIDAYVQDSERQKWVQTSDDGNWMHVETNEIWDEMEHCGMLPWEESGDTEDEDAPQISVSRWSGMSESTPKNFALPAENLHNGTPSVAKVKPMWYVPPGRNSGKVDLAKTVGKHSYATLTPEQRKEMSDKVFPRSRIALEEKKAWFAAPAPPE